MDINSLTNLYSHNNEDEICFKRMVYWAKKLHLPQDIFKYTFIFQRDLNNNFLEYLSQYKLIGMTMSDKIFSAISEIGNILSVFQFVAQREDKYDYDLKNPNFIKDDEESTLLLNQSAINAILYSQPINQTSSFSSLFQQCVNLTTGNFNLPSATSFNTSSYSFSNVDNITIDIDEFFRITYPIIDEKISKWPKTKIENKKLIISLV